MLTALLLTSAMASDFDTLYADAGWEEVTVAKTKDAGEVDIRLKVIEGGPCLRGTLQVNVPAKNLYDVVTDIPSAPSFSSEALHASRFLSQKEKHSEYYQHLDVPNWTMAADRYWVLRGTDLSTADTLVYQWDRFDWKASYPELAASIAAEHASAVEVSPNFGAWKFTEKDGTTHAKYYLCSNPGGNLPEWLQKAAATKTLPNTVADVVREARKRAGS